MKYFKVSCDEWMSAGRLASGEVRLPHQHLPPAGLYQGSSAPSGTGAGPTRAQVAWIQIWILEQCSRIRIWINEHPDPRIRTTEVLIRLLTWGEKREEIWCLKMLFSLKGWRLGFLCCLKVLLWGLRFIVILINKMWPSCNFFLV